MMAVKNSEIDCFVVWAVGDLGWRSVHGWLGRWDGGMANGVALWEWRGPHRHMNWHNWHNKYQMNIPILIIHFSWFWCVVLCCVGPC